MKAKTGFESGSSPTAPDVKFSESGSPIQTGRGLGAVERAIREAFAIIRQHPAQQPVPPTSQVEFMYTAQHKERFQKRAQRLALDALTSSHISKARHGNVWEIEVPTQTSEELIAAALRRFEETT